MKKSPKPPQQKSPRIIAGLPAFNEEHYIGSIILKTRQYVDEVIIVDDGSNDRTAEIARLAGATVIQHKQNMGYGASIQSLIAKAKKIKPDIFVLLDADSQHNPDEIPALINPISEGFDIVIGSRYARREDVPRYRRFGQRIISNFSRVLSGEQVSDSESGFRAFSGKAIASLTLKESGMAVSAETISRASEEGLKITEIPISIRYTTDSSTLNPFLHGFEVLSRIIVMISEKRPLFFFGLGGIIITALGLVAGSIALNIYFEGGVAVTGWTLIASLLLIVGSISIFTGIILNLLAKRKT
jgi:glycosyltransferase involved in cell wall biosynthesis